MAQLVVMECDVGTPHQPRTLWAWGLVVDAPGFVEVTYTEPDGVTFAEPPGEGVPLLRGRHLFSVAVERDPDQESRR